MNSLDRYTGDCVCAVPFKEISNNQTFYVNDSTIDLYPGYNPSSIYTNESYANHAMDKWATSVRLHPERNLIKVFTKSEETPALKGKSLLNFRRKEIQTQITEKILCQFQIISKGAEIYCGPSSVENLRQHINSKLKVTLEDDLYMFPDYSNLAKNLVTTPDQFMIKISKGSEVFIRTGGGVGNIQIILEMGKITMNYNPDVQIPGCLCPANMDHSLFSFAGRFLEA